MAKNKPKPQLNPNDVISRHCKHSYIVTSAAAAVQEIMEMSGPTARRLLRDMIDMPIEPPNDIVSKLATSYLVQIELNFRRANDGMTLLPFNTKDYKEGLEYGRKNEESYKNFDSDGNSTDSNFQVMYDYVMDNPEYLQMVGKKAAEKLAKKLDMGFNTCYSYLSKIKKLNKEG